MLEGLLEGHASKLLLLCRAPVSLASVRLVLTRYMAD
jgi:hypothetical protein